MIQGKYARRLLIVTEMLQPQGNCPPDPPLGLCPGFDAFIIFRQLYSALHPRLLASSSHISALIWTMYLELRKISKVRQLISTDCATLLVSSLILFIGLPSERLKRLQTVQNNTEHLVLKKSKCDPPNPPPPDTSIIDSALVSSLKRISYEFATMSNKCICDKAPSYLTNIMQLYTPSLHLRSSSDSKIFVTRRLKSTLKKHGIHFLKI